MRFYAKLTPQTIAIICGATAIFLYFTGSNINEIITYFTNWFFRK